MLFCFLFLLLLAAKKDPLIDFYNLSDSTKTPVDLDDIEDEHLPQISLQEMLDDMKLVDPTGGDGAEMIE